MYIREPPHFRYSKTAWSAVVVKLRDGWAIWEYVGNQLCARNYFPRKTVRWIHAPFMTYSGVVKILSHATYGQRERTLTCHSGHKFQSSETHWKWRLANNFFIVPSWAELCLSYEVLNNAVDFQICVIKSVHEFSLFFELKKNYCFSLRHI